MNTCCNNIYPDEDLRRWEVGCSVPYYTKAEIDEKLENIDISGDCISSGDVQNMIDASVEPIEGSVEALSGTVGELSAGMENKAEKSEIPSLSGYATQEWVNNQGYLTQHQPLKMVNGESLSGNGNIEGATSSNNGYGISILNGGTRWKINALLPIAGETLETAYNRNEITEVNGLNTYLGNYAIGKWNDSNMVYDSSQDRYVPPYFEIGNGTDNNNRHNIFTILENGKVLLEDDRILQNWIADVEYVANRAASDVANKQDTLVSGWNIKTINGQSLIGEGNITISGGGSADLSNYYTKTETNDLLDDKLDASAYTPSDLSQYWTSAQTQSAIDAATQGKADASDVLSNVQVSPNGSANYTWLNTFKNGTTGTTGYFGKINGTPVASRYQHEVKNMSLVDTSAITSSITSASTDAQVPSAKATYDALSNKADASNVYTKTEVNNIVNNKFVCITQAQYDALPTKQPDTLYLIYEV